MTIDRRRRANDGLSATESRLAVITALATSYLVAWAWLVVRPLGAADADVAVGTPDRAHHASAVAPRSPAVCCDQLPPADRPALTIPEGFRLATREATTEPLVALEPRRAPARRPMRIRTRSS